MPSPEQEVGEGEMFPTRGCAGEERLASRDVVGKTAAGQNHPFTRRDCGRSIGGLDGYAGDPVSLFVEVAHGHFRGHGDPQILRRFGKAGDQRHPIDQMRGPPKARQIDDVA
jgi:hypothetical protein